MKLFACSVYDAAVGAYIPPQFYRSQGEAMRAFVQACQDEAHQFRRHAKDYTLFCIAEFDDGRGEVVPVLPAVMLVTALQAVEMATR